MTENFEQNVIKKMLNGIMPLTEEEIGLLLRYTENELNSAIIRRVVDHCFREVIHLKALIFGLVELVPEAKTTGENILFDLRNLYRRRYELEVLHELLKRHPVAPSQYQAFLADDIRDLDTVAQENEEALVMGAGLCTASVYMDSLFLAREELDEDRWWLPRCEELNERKSQ